MARTFHNQVVVPMPKAKKPVEKPRGGAKNNKHDLLSEYEDDFDSEDTAPESLPPQAA